ncbi:MAG: hypothetical protein MUC89_04875 [Acetobacteraceae bacterium]|jgi:hypothetical protein|nr:hypothetical protein [Acetobacteraceae bacterium]
MSVRAIMAGSEAASSAGGGVPAVVFSRGAYQAVAPAAVLRREAGPGAGEDEQHVWGFRVSAAMCRCRHEVAQAAADARMFAAAYRRCDAPPTNDTADAIDRCVRTGVLRSARGASPQGAVVLVEAGSTGLFGPIRCEPQPPGPCGAIAYRACRVHETFHDRQRRSLGSRIGRASGDRGRGEAFALAYRRALAEPDEAAARERIRRTYPEEYRALVLSWNEGSIMARSEAEAFTRQHQFLADMGRALETICT